MSGFQSCSLWAILKMGRKCVSRLWLICSVNMMWAFMAEQSRNYGTKSQIWNNDLFPYEIDSLLKSHLGHFFWASWPLPSPVSAPGTTRSMSLCRGESILNGLNPLSLDTSAAWRAQWWGYHTWQSCEIWLNILTGSSVIPFVSVSNYGFFSLCLLYRFWTYFFL